MSGDWTRLREAARARLDDDLRALEFEARAARRVLEREVPTLTSAFNSAPEILARVLATSGAERARDLFHLADEALPRVLAFGDEPPARAPGGAVEVVNYLALMRSVGREPPQSAAGLEARWLRLLAPRPDLLNDFDVRTAALAAVAVGEHELVPGLAGGGPLVPRTEPRDVAGPNLPGLARHLAECVVGGGGSDSVEGAWWTFLEVFPHTLAGEGARWVDLVWVAVIMMVHFEQRPWAEVGTWLPKLVADLE